MSMSAGGSSSTVTATPNVTPMIDVMLVLLIIFMVVVPQLLAGFQVSPPIGINLKDHPDDHDLDQVLGIDVHGAYFFNKIPIQHDDVAGKLQEIYAAPTRTNYVLYLKADKTLKYEKVMDMMDIASKNKVRVVALVSDQKNGTVSSIAGDLVKPGGK